jgi:hypothetical protein
MDLLHSGQLIIAIAHHPTPPATLAQGLMRRLLLGVAGDFALRQRLLKFSNLCLGEVGVQPEFQPL